MALLLQELEGVSDEESGTVSSRGNGKEWGRKAAPANPINSDLFRSLGLGRQISWGLSPVLV